MSVAIIGGGLSGLAAAKACRDAGLRPQIFEQSTALGGLWSPQSSLARQWMQTNASKHICSFSDHPWTAKRTFPTTREMGQYLNSYAAQYLDPSMINLGKRVVRAERTDAGKWVITWTGDVVVPQGCELFDNIIVASGIFSKPAIPKLDGAAEFHGRIIHSADLRDLNEVRGKRVVIVGDSFSAVELAAEIAPVTSSLLQIHPRPFWAFPRIIPFDAAKPDSPFAPADMINFTRSRHRGSGENVFPTQEAVLGKNSYFRGVCGDQGHLAESLKVPPDQPSFVAVSDTYLNSVRHGSIKPILGYLAGFRGSSLVLRDGTVLPNEVDVVIMSTGFGSAMSFFDPETLKDIAFDPDNLRHPVLLYRSVFHPSPRLQNAAFVGLYRGPYMGAVELHAKWAARVFAGQQRLPSSEEQLTSIEFEKSIREANPPLQFPHGDYVGLMQDLSSVLGIDPQATWEGRDIDVVSAAQFNHGDVPSQMIGEIETALAASRKGKWVSAAVFNALQGDWDISRRLESFAPNYPSGTFTGIASFTRSTTSPEGLQDGPDYEYKYLERGKLRTDAGTEFDAQRRYRYRYDDEEDRIDAYFDDSSGEGHFHALRILSPGEIPDPKRGYNGQWEPWVNESQPGWRATGAHWCAPDNYTVAYWFTFKGIHLEEFRISYKVQGPSKDYISTATYTRT